MTTRSGNIPLTRAQMALLPIGFTSTSVHPTGLTGQQIKHVERHNPYPHTNRKVTPGRNVQVAPKYMRDLVTGKLLVNEAGDETRVLVGYKQIFHHPIRIQH